MYRVENLGLLNYYKVDGFEWNVASASNYLSDYENAQIEMIEKIWKDYLNLCNNNFLFYLYRVLLTSPKCKI